MAIPTEIRDPANADAGRAMPDAASSAPAVHLDAVEKRYGDVVAVAGITLDVRDGEFFSLLGPSGSGKTTTLRMIAGFEQPTAGRIELHGREKEVLGLIAHGLSNAEIGQRLFISPMTVKAHVHHIFEKLGVKSRAEAALRAAQIGRD